MSDKKTFSNFWEFYPFYLSQHQNPTCRTLHFIGTWIVVFLLTYSLVSSEWIYLLFLPIAGYGFAWIGHFFFEKNKPATFTYPIYSLMGDWVMWWQLNFRKLPFKEHR
ncbi:MAG: DUF962 domain-containing protein [Leptospiraceae bacterium]|nr:DUF962 domain-containing protein [Leptospiraceae bacterium]